jgi:hypothetical protein
VKKEDKQVQTALAKAGYEGWPAGSRGELFETLARIRRQYPLVSEDFVDQQREILSKAMHQEEVVELGLVRILHPFIKACPECRHKPDLGSSYTTSNGEYLVVCMNHPLGAVTRGGVTLAAAVKSWNADDWFHETTPRDLFPL